MERIRHSRHYLIALDDDCCSCKYRPLLLLLLSFDTQTILIYCISLAPISSNCAAQDRR